jgi:acyl carrier protein
MTEQSNPDLQDAVVALIADTFDVSPRGINAATAPGEVAGWDSLGHSVLLTRLSRRFGLQITECLAAPVDSVGELVSIVRQAAGQPAHG